MARCAEIVICLAVTVGMTAQSPLEDAVRQAYAAEQDGRFDVAVRAYDQALSMADPSNTVILAGLLYRKARALRESGDTLRAIQAIKQAIHFRQDDRFAALQRELELRHDEGVVSARGIVQSLLEAKRLHRSFGVSGKKPSLDIRVGFEYDSDTLTAQGKRQASEMADAMLSQEFAGDRFQLVGHTDARGGADYNFDLSMRRATALREWLVDRFGFRDDRIDAVGRGEEDLVASGESEAAHARNRRVQLVLLEGTR